MRRHKFKSRLRHFELIGLRHPAGDVFFRSTCSGKRLEVSLPLPRVGQEVAICLPGLPLCRVERIPGPAGEVWLIFDTPGELPIGRLPRHEGPFRAAEEGVAKHE